eukprot:6346935-Alexandrium_andersonii.AAC.1
MPDERPRLRAAPRGPAEGNDVVVDSARLLADLDRPLRAPLAPPSVGGGRARFERRHMHGDK